MIERFGVAPPLAIVIPAFERPIELERALRSVVAQKVECEIVVVDDASPRPLALPDDLSRLPNIRLIRRATNGGAGAARNAGIARTTAPIVGFLDSDDWMPPASLARRLAAARALAPDIAGDAVVAVGCGWSEHDRAGKPVRTRIPVAPSGRRDFHRGCWVSPGSAVLFSRAALRTVGAFDENLRRLEDVDYFIRFENAGGRFLVDPHAGVAISGGSQKSAAAISGAIDWLSRKYAAELRADPAASRHLHAYFDLEKARMAHGEGRAAKAAWLLARSFWRLPRLRVNTGRGWLETRRPAD